MMLPEEWGRSDAQDLATGELRLVAYYNSRHDLKFWRASPPYPDYLVVPLEQLVRLCECGGSGSVSGDILSFATHEDGPLQYLFLGSVAGQDSMERLVFQRVKDE